MRVSGQRRLAALAVAAATCAVLAGASSTGSAPLERRPGRAGRAVALRPRAQGLPRHGAQHDVEGVVHGRERRAQRRPLPDDRQHERRDPAVPGHRRVDVHGSPDQGHDLDGRGARPHRDGLQGHEHARQREVPDRHRLRRRPGRRRDPDEGRVQGRPEGEARRPAPLRPLRPDGERQRRGRRRQRRRRLGDDRHLHAVTPFLVASDPNTATNAVNRDYAQPVYAALDAPFAEATSGFAGTASDGLTQLDAAHALTTLVHDGEQRQRRPDGADLARPEATTAATSTSRSRSASARARRPRCRRQGSAEAPVRQALAESKQGWAAYDNGAQRPAEEAPGDRQQARPPSCATRTS